MQIKDLKEIIKDLPDEMEIAVWDYNGIYPGKAQVVLVEINSKGEVTSFPTKKYNNPSAGYKELSILYISAALKMANSECGSKPWKTIFDKVP